MSDPDNEPMDAAQEDPKQPASETAHTVSSEAAPPIRLQSRTRPTRRSCGKAANTPGAASPSPPWEQPPDGAYTSGSITASG